MAEIAALGAALCWAMGGVFAASAARQMGGIAFTRIRMLMVFGLLLCVVLVTGSTAVAANDLPLLMLSGFFGVFIGDTALFVTMSRLGPRRTGILFATNAPMTVGLSWLIFDEQLHAVALIGCGLVAIGVFIAIVYGKRANQIHIWEEVQGHLLTGIGIGLLAALCQSIGSLMVAPALSHGADPLSVATIRIGAALIALYAARGLFPAQTKSKQTLNKNLIGRMFMSGFLGMALGMTLLLYAFSQGSIGLSAALSSTTPVMLVPIIWLVSRERPAFGAWIGAAFAVAGSILIVMHR
ncbi:DMT family transporter [Granulosicoccus antarcticus]|uniref:EamA domain-containing protein n=1 Tax=Granulosicoccus antarcticus IMCC3135 TaxID=1192854 RepID=A0A2Z2NVR7_9GAMM|nr:DMT family transporter [Granulosicoccus antarcticus]ASJ71757.1 hypothetical protein IMCC3135_08270 [Granulosicoccus antarcticus IMCC3135]